MDSWTVLLMVQMLQGQHLSTKPLREQDWTVFWFLVHDMDGVIEHLGLTSLVAWEQG